MEKLSKGRKKAEADRKKAEAEMMKAPEGNINGADYSAPVVVEQHGESSRMAESRGAIGGGFAFDDPALTSEETNWARDLNERHTELVSGSDEMMVDAPANQEDRSANPFPVVTYDSHVSSIPLREHQRLATPSPVPTETTDSFNDELDANQTFEYPSPTRDFSTAPYPIVLRGLPSAPHSSPGPSDLTAENLDPLPWSPAFPQSPVDHPSSPQIPIDPVLLEIDAERVQREMGL
ncbi:hypothetical protein MMC22_002296 [Lobaria immixta]|nr:hypothetical protein [Lobaria immixta]